MAAANAAFAARAWIVARTSGRGWNRPAKAKLDQIKPGDECVDHAYGRVGRHIILNPRGQQHRLILIVSDDVAMKMATPFPRWP